MVEGLTYIEDPVSMGSGCSSSLFSSLRRIAAVHRGVEQWQLVGLITRRSGVRIPSPLPNNQKALPPEGLSLSRDGGKRPLPSLPAFD